MLISKQVINKSFTDFDALSEALQGWELELYKLDSSPFTGSFFQLISPDLIISRGHFNSRLKQIGQPPRGFRTFAVLGSPEVQILWRGKYMNGNDLVLFPPNSELYSSTNSNFDIFTISLKEQMLQSVVEELQFVGFKDRYLLNEVFHCRRGHMDYLLKMLRSACIEHELNPLLTPAGASRQIAVQLIQMVASGSGNSFKKPTPLRQEIIQKVDQHIIQYPEEPPTIPDLCVVTGASKRTLEYAFNEYFGLTPKAYVNALRLNAVRKQLRSTKAEDSYVVDVANAWGFWHMGQFAADYRKLFGELPSRTIKATA